MSKAAPIEDPRELAGTSVYDQNGEKLGDVTELYAPGGDGDPMWAMVELSQAAFRSRNVFIPLARMKHEDDEVRVPYSLSRIAESPEVEAGDELSPEDDEQLRAFYNVGGGDGELTTDTDSYAAQVPEGDEPAKRI
jgi:sporulation protein YlmC with PRC-barrel domain